MGAQKYHTFQLTSVVNLVKNVVDIWCLFAESSQEITTEAVQNDNLASFV